MSQKYNMNPKDPQPIPTPWSEHWKDLRLRVIPVVVFVSAVGLIALLWKDHVAAPSMVGQAEPVIAQVSCYKAGLVAEFTAARFQKVKSGDLLGRVMITDPKILASSLAVIQSEIEMLQADLRPIVRQQHTAMDYDQMRLDWMKQRAQLATAKVNLQLAEAEYQRMSELFKDKIVAQRVYEQARAARERSQNEVDELSKMVAAGEENFRTLQVTNSTELAKVSTTPLIAAIAVQEAKLRQMEAELSPIPLKAPMDGTVTMIYCRAGEAVTAGQPIASIATLNAVRIVGYMRPPIMKEPAAGMKVQVRTRGPRREIGWATIMEVGTQLESIPPVVMGPIKLPNPELGLPVDISLPPNLKIRAGELVDVVLRAN
jgi:multidrug resistance efflux pump